MAAETKPLMPKATAVWLVDNTGLTFEQIADFCGLHPLEVKGIADEDVAKGIKGMDPVTSGQLTREQIEEAEKNPKIRLKMAAPKHKMPAVKQKKAPRYTPVSKRQDKPDAVYWILRNHPEFADADIIRLIGTTKATIQKIRERSHWNATNIKAVDPVTLGLCSQLELDLAVTRATQAARGDTCRYSRCPCSRVAWNSTFGQRSIVTCRLYLLVARNTALPSTSVAIAAACSRSNSRRVPASGNTSQRAVVTLAPS
jgi:hypothetical protein